MAGIRAAIEAGFVEINRRLDDHQDDTKALESKVHDLEIYRAREEARCGSQKIMGLEHKVEDLESLKWKLLGMSTAAATIMTVAGWALTHAMGGH